LGGSVGVNEGFGAFVQGRGAAVGAGRGGAASETADGDELLWGELGGRIDNRGVKGWLFGGGQPVDLDIPILAACSAVCRQEAVAVLVISLKSHYHHKADEKKHKSPENYHQPLKASA